MGLEPEVGIVPQPIKERGEEEIFLVPDHKKDGGGAVLNLFCRIRKLLFLNVINGCQCVTTVIHKQILEFIKLSFTRNNI